MSGRKRVETARDESKERFTTSPTRCPSLSSVERDGRTAKRDVADQTRSARALEGSLRGRSRRVSHHVAVESRHSTAIVSSRPFSELQAIAEPSGTTPRNCAESAFSTFQLPVSTIQVPPVA